MGPIGEMHAEEKKGPWPYEVIRSLLRQHYAPPFTDEPDLLKGAIRSRLLFRADEDCFSPLCRV